MAVAAVVVLGLAAVAFGGDLPEKRFSVQTATFVARELAQRHIQDLVKVLPEDYLGDLRVENTGKYHVVRFGSFSAFAQAETAREAVRSFSPDAFILNESPETPSPVVFLYPDLSAGEGPFLIEVGPFPTEDEARRQREALAASIGEQKVVSRLRVDAKDDSFRILLTGFDDLSAAREMLKTVRSLEEHAAVRRQAPDEGGEVLSASDGGTGEERIRTRKTRFDVAREKPRQETGKEPAADFNPLRQVRTFDEIDREMAQLMDGREYGKAVSLIKGAIEEWPENPELHAWYGNVLLAMDRPDKAVGSFRKAAELAPALPQYQSDLGHSLMYVHMDTAKEAIRVFQKALALDPENADALEGLGTVYLSIGQTARAEDIYQNLLEVDPDAAERLHNALRYGIDWNR